MPPTVLVIGKCFQNSQGGEFQEISDSDNTLLYSCCSHAVLWIIQHSKKGEGYLCIENGKAYTRVLAAVLCPGEICAYSMQFQQGSFKVHHAFILCCLAMAGHVQLFRSHDY